MRNTDPVRGAWPGQCSQASLYSCLVSDCYSAFNTEAGGVDRWGAAERLHEVANDTGCSMARQYARRIVDGDAVCERIGGRRQAFICVWRRMLDQAGMPRGRQPIG
jgi:hypothetical protein